MARTPLAVMNGADRDDPDSDVLVNNGAAVAPPPASMQDLPDSSGGGDEPIITRRPAREPAREFDIIETDDDFKPLRQDREPAITADEAGDGTYLDRQQGDERSSRRKELTPEEKREQRRQTRQHRRESRDANIAENRYLKQQLAELAARLDGIEPRFSEFDQERQRTAILEIDRQITEATRAGEAARRQLSAALAAGDHDGIDAALTERDTATRSLANLELRKQVAQTQTIVHPNGDGQQQQRQQPQPQQRRAPPPPSPATQAFIDDFRGNFPWANLTDPGNPETRTILALDNALANEGYDAETPEYWDELEDRMARAPSLRHRFSDGRRQPDDVPPKGAQQQPQRQAEPARRGPPVSGASDRAPANGSNQKVYLSPGRKDALIRAGVLAGDGRTVQNREKFTRMMDQYAKYDRENGPQQAR